jgi:hypothetical protein
MRRFFVPNMTLRRFCSIAQNPGSWCNDGTRLRFYTFNHGFSNLHFAYWHVDGHTKWNGKGSIVATGQRIIAP